jgi:hypothetical protein
MTTPDPRQADAAFQPTSPTPERRMTKEFKAGARVRLVATQFRRQAPAGLYRIVRQMPDNGREPQYRIKSESEPHERVARLSELETV